MIPRSRLPTRRRAETLTARVAGHKLHLTLGYYADGRLGEVFIDLHKVGSFSRGMLHSLARLLSCALQYGVPADVLASMLAGTDFEPAGKVTGVPGVSRAKSIVDLVAQVISAAGSRVT